MAEGLTKDTMSDEDKSLLQFVRKRFDSAERLQKFHRERWNTWYALSRNYRRLKQARAQATTPNDRDTVMQEFRRKFGEELFIPYGFTVIETNLPRVLASDPRIAAKPEDESAAAREACEPVKRLFERDQKRMKYELRLQETVRSGLRYGLGVQKLWWNQKYRSGLQVAPKVSEDGYKLEKSDKILVFEGPDALSVDIFDFFWDPKGYDLASCGYVIHRAWLSPQEVEDRVAEGKKRREEGHDGGWAELDIEGIKGLASDSKRGEIHQERWEAAGISGYNTQGNNLFEVWEYHDRDKVITVLGKELIVQNAPNPYLHGDFPFQIYRPTIMEHEFVGVGEIEPIAHLQYELNTMRGQRRDAADIALNRGYFYSQGMLNPKSVTTGAGVFVPVQGDPKDVVYPMPFSDIPQSSVSEEEALKRDIELTTGISESTVGSSGEETATGTQLVQAAANTRIRQKAKNMLPDLLRPATKQQRELYKQHLSERKAQTIRVEQDPSVGTGYTFVTVGPKEINANIEVEPIDGSTEAQNEVQKRQDAVQLVDALAPFLAELDQPKFVKYLLEQFGIDQPETYIVPPEPKAEEIVPAIGHAMAEAGINPEEVTQILEKAKAGLAEAPAPTEGPPEGPPKE